MKRTTATALLATIGLIGASTAASAAPPAPVDLGDPLDAAHAHNDYEHERPLFDALSHGCTSVEADVWLVDGELLVAHDLADVDSDRTLESLYLDPLTDLIRSGQGRSVYPDWDGSLQLLIDIKSESESTWAAIEAALAEHRQLVTRYVRGRVLPGPVTAVISGNRPLETMAAAEHRFSFYDGRATDLTSGLPAALMPLVSHNWTQLFSWSGVGEMPADERAELHAYVATAHAAGYRVRFWATPDVAGPERDAVWAELVAAGVDHINTDDLAALETFLSR
ncbi:phosphatidylinositol-specific phospholipase C/glycerophosphodiester phosphodiesterase family protein [Occultella kanbiaonis]|uniref:phosphatidylinositol-specific phospholipase C/glycerophosphodiester phosphodiesterase family protein n=1 Tax=Occultella kanbiaonis TaxID=2675754 RepID=UPI001E456D39|nr:phosphatidylinositol-specific phospholipase C/glycerophosphodiester phosphodiesterase family protein [Occultella kanbiaonis]